VRLVKANDHVLGDWFIHLVVTTKELLAHPITTVPVTVWRYPVFVKRLTCSVSPLFTIPVSPLACQLMIRYPEVVLGSNDTVTGTGIFMTPAVYIAVVYHVPNAADQLPQKVTHSGIVSRIANVSAIYFPELYCEGIRTSELSALYLTGTICLYIFNPNA